MSLAPLLAALPQIQVHAFAALAAFVLGAVQLAAPKGTLPHRTLAETRRWVEAMIAIPPDEGEDFVVEHQGEVIGKAGLYRFPRIGFILHPDHWGKGFAGEALRDRPVRDFQRGQVHFPAGK